MAYALPPARRPVALRQPNTEGPPLRLGKPIPASVLDRTVERIATDEALRQFPTERNGLVMLGPFREQPMESPTVLLSIGLSAAVAICVTDGAVAGSQLPAQPTQAAEEVWALGRPRTGQSIPRTVRIIGVDGESRPRQYGIVIFDGKIVALVEGSTRKVVEIVSDDAR